MAGRGHVHDFRDPSGFEDGTYGWRACACSGSIPGHPECADPAGGPGCGMAYRLCAACDHIDESPLVEVDALTASRPTGLAVA